MAIAPIFYCSNCGHVVNVEVHDEVVPEIDDTVRIDLCGHCGRDVRPVYDDKGEQCYRGLTNEEIEEENLQIMIKEMYYPDQADE